MNYSIAIIIGAALIAGAFAISHRYQIVTAALAPNYVVAWRLDNWTGDILYCDYANPIQIPNAVSCGPLQMRK